MYDIILYTSREQRAASLQMANPRLVTISGNIREYATPIVTIIIIEHDIINY